MIDVFCLSKVNDDDDDDDDDDQPATFQDLLYSSPFFANEYRSAKFKNILRSSLMSESREYKKLTRSHISRPVASDSKLHCVLKNTDRYA